MIHRALAGLGRAPLLAAILLAPPALAHDGENDCGSRGDAAFSGDVIAAPIDCVAHLGGADDGRDSNVVLVVLTVLTVLSGPGGQEQGDHVTP